MNTTADQTAHLVATIEARGDLRLDDGDRGRTDPAIRTAYLEAARRFLDSDLPYPEGRYSGRGVVICGGGRYFPCAWVAIRMLRHLGSDLPIELWYFGPDELDDRQLALVRALGVEPVDASEVRREHPVHHLGGWELKCFALIHSRFREVLLLDADNVPLVDPSGFFEWPEYRATGAVFWPDLWRSKPESSAWAAFGVAYRDEFEFESGQILLDKRLSWRPLRLAWHYNDHSGYYYRHIYGDKDTFRMAWHRLGTPFTMPTRPMEQIECCMCQHDPAGDRVLQHRNMDKYRLDGVNRELEGYRLDETCRQFLAELRTLWREEPYTDPRPTHRSSSRAAALRGGEVTWRRHDGATTTLHLGTDGRATANGFPTVSHWDIRELDGEVYLSLLGTDPSVALLRETGDAWTAPVLVVARADPGV